jgi:hypothetical protein
LPFPQHVPLWRAEAIEVSNMLGMLAEARPACLGQSSLEGRPDDPSRGYVMVRVWDHPRARSGGYVFEHVVVMEAVLGRPVRVDESVHHENGVRHDDRPETLELWIRPQQAGIRVEDAIAWAREILARYGDRVDHPQQR